MLPARFADKHAPMAAVAQLQMRAPIWEMEKIYQRRERYKGVKTGYGVISRQPKGRHNLLQNYRVFRN